MKENNSKSNFSFSIWKSAWEPNKSLGGKKGITRGKPIWKTSQSSPPIGGRKVGNKLVILFFLISFCISNNTIASVLIALKPTLVTLPLKTSSEKHPPPPIYDPDVGDPDIGGPKEGNRTYICRTKS